MKRIVATVASFILTIAIIVGVACYLGYLFRPTSSDVSLATIDAFHSLEENSVDVIIYGSSHPWRGVNSLMLQEDYGIRNYNYSCMWQNINTTRLFVNDSLITQNPKLAIIDTYNVNHLLKDTELVGEVYYTKKIPDSDVKKVYLKQCFGDNQDKWIGYYIPIAAFHGGWSDINRNSFSNANLNPQQFISSRGFISFDEAQPVNIMNPDEYWQEPLSDEAIAELDAIVADLQSKGTQILFITIPYYSGEYMYGDAMAKYADEHGIPYINMMYYIDEIGLDGATDFSEADHVNRSGADKITRFLGDYIKENYEF